MVASDDFFLSLAKGLIAWSAFLFASLLFTEAKYGRYAENSFYVMNGKLGWFIQELPALIVPILLLCFTECHGILYNCNRALLTLYIIHYVHRIFIYPFYLKGKPLPLYMVVLAFMFCLFNGYLQSGYLLYSAEYRDEWITCPQLIIGLVMFISGLGINIHSDHILRNLRKPGETGYKIPKGGMFDYISGANFFGEILEWWGFAVACNSLPALAFAISTSCNLGPRAVHHHRWYKKKFEEYPRCRKAIIPFLF
ncbi:3-oxo-5-alpha-steroid 4-dehydrogenase 1-like [Mytilus californianus]|uniref:3-oxo-5-alpha-steroid 4-dehydrogenase 1-like n=1 Tax=Mytilus californianus TaxID=6549 RepID=UPI0022475D20|nr:3-oxo-5-alpha-steroid 4-dehydrogenase 1-like [Mytilus californianus]